MKQDIYSLPGLHIAKTFGAGVIAFALGASAIAQPFNPQLDFVPGEVLVQFKSTVTDPELAQAFRQAGLNMLKHVQTTAMKDHGQIGITHAATALPVPAALRILNNLPGVDYAEANWIARSDVESNDPFYLDGTLWGVFGDDLPSPTGPASTTNPFGSQAEKAWAAGLIGSRDVFVGIIDSGFQFDHSDLAANIWTNPGEIPGNGIDDDGDGYIDDIYGWNSLDDNGNIYDPALSHGTHVSGTLGAQGGNGIGIAGVNWNVSLISGMFLGPNGGSYLDAIQVVDYMTMLKTKKGLNIVALNNSWSGPAFSQALLDSYTRAAQAGILSICAAHNATNNNDSVPRYPGNLDTTAGAGYDAIVSVAAIDQNGSLASFSDYGLTTVDLGAPGVGIYSTVSANGYAYKSGTSMATPHVAGAVALYASLYPAATAAEIKSRLLTVGVVPTPSLSGKTLTGGRLDVNVLISGPPSTIPVPATPSSVTAAGSRGVVNLAWTDRSNNEKGFVIERKISSSTSWQGIVTLSPNSSKFSDTSIASKSTYNYRIRTFNAAGSSAYSNVATATTK